MVDCCGEPAPQGMSFSLPPIMIAPAGDGLGCLQLTIIPGSSAVVDKDGTIEFQPAEDWRPADISGYTRDDGNPFLFRPQWPVCERRYHGTKHLPDGSLDVLMICDHKAHPKYKGFVDCATCQSCDLRTEHSSQFERDTIPPLSPQ